MVLQDLFEKNKYINIREKKDAVPFELSVDMFYDGEERIPKELIYLYISRMKDELFFVLDSRGWNIVKLCEKWDKKISIFINFGNSDRKTIQRLKYNIVQILLYEDKEKIDHSQEGSLNVTRKVLMPCVFKEDGTVEISDEEAVEIPFYLITAGNSEKNEEIENKLKECLPLSDNELMDMLCIKKKPVQRRTNGNVFKKNFSENDYNRIKEWLSTNGNTNS